MDSNWIQQASSLFEVDLVGKNILNLQEINNWVLQSGLSQLKSIGNIENEASLKSMTNLALEHESTLLIRTAVLEKLRIHGWNLIADECFLECIKKTVYTKVKSIAKINESCLYPSLDWLNCYFLPWVRSHFDSMENLQYWESFTIHEFYYSIGLIRIEQIFDLILDFPETKPAIDDLAEALKYCDLSKILENKTKEQLIQRAVHCSKSTDGILLVYINLTKIMPLLFPTINLLESISGPLKQELRSRTDTFKCIIKTISEDEELYALLDIKQKSIKEQDDFSSDEDEKSALDWQPIPRSALRNVISALNKKSDIVSMLINIYGSPELFMEEYRTYLCKKLWNNTQFEVGNEIKDLEMLKKRFGEGNVHKCEVMIQDILSSKRINAFVHEKGKGKGFLPIKSLDFLIISSYFWPLEEQDMKFELPEKIGKVFEEYSELYTYMKASRKLKFHEQLGSVTLTLDFANGSKKFEGVTPLHAAIISLFDEDDREKSSEDLSKQLGIHPHKLRKEISFWESRGVLQRNKKGEEYYYSAVKVLNNLE
ncbi:unnamed protein product [Blepharisma stoltei]|uniref:Cullin family profile domain-containing protein n=1 Tax=Blepharisma stoltei TaxID=1481888 RepID=A0AAU9K6I6_9CILI|nr:unnamed protein product [Blepharisma stoltei]